MLTKIKLGCALLTVLMLAGLVMAHLHAGSQGQLLMAIPRVNGINISTQLMENASNRGMMLTWENRHAETVTALNISRSAVLIGTNHNFPFVMEYTVSHGRFFREYAVRYRHRVAVLNMHASFMLFGTMEATGNEIIINNLPYTVTGVIDDGEPDEINIYTPWTLREETIETIATNLAMSPALTDIGIMNEWQRIGIEGHQYRYVNFEVIQTLVRDKVITAFALIIAVAMTLVLSKTYSAAKKQATTLRYLTHDAYIWDVLAKPPVWKLLGTGIAIAGTGLAIALIAMDSFMRGLVAYDARGMLANVQPVAFSRQISEMARWYNFSNLFFLGFVIFFAFFILLNIRKD